MKIKVAKKEYEINEINLQDRCELNDMLIERAEKASFSMWVKVIQICTDLSDDEINNLNSSEIIELGSKCVDFVNKKKDKT